MSSMNNKLTINEFPKNIPDFKNSVLPKDRLTEQWLTNWIINSLKANKIQAGDILPQKNIIAQYLGVSIGTVQNAIRYTEDKGFLQSIQRKGTFIASISDHTEFIKKQTSKRDEAIYKVKQYIIDNGIGYVMPSAAEVAKTINISKNTVRLAYLRLCDMGILQYTSGRSGKKLLKVLNIPKEKDEQAILSKSLVEKTIDDLTKFINENLKKGDKLQTRSELAELLRVSVKTVHDAINRLEQQGILQSRRGRYGTVVVKMPEDINVFLPVNEYSIFRKSGDSAFYQWEKIENNLLNMIKTEYEAGMKLPSMEDLAIKFDVSTNTIRKALKNLSEKGIVDFERGRYGGTFVIEVPDNTNSAGYEWLAVTQDFAPIQSGN